MGISLAKTNPFITLKKVKNFERETYYI